jgi:uncharacterized protein (DUF1697 family)
VAQSAAPVQRYIAFLRAINVGGHTVKMNQLRELFAAIELANVETFIASGNVIFETPEADAQALERRIERQLLASLGYAVATFLRTPTELAAVAGYQPFAPQELAAEGNLLYVAFLPVPPAEAEHQKLLAFRTPSTIFISTGVKSTGCVAQGSANRRFPGHCSKRRSVCRPRCVTSPPSSGWRRNTQPTEPALPPTLSSRCSASRMADVAMRRSGYTNIAILDLRGGGVWEGATSPKPHLWLYGGPAASKPPA